MSWLYSIILAGVMFSTGGELALPGKNYHTYGEPASPKTIQLDETEKFEQTYPLNPNGKVSVSNINGSITVEASDKPEVRLEVTKIADSRETLNDVEIKIDAQPASFNVEADYNRLRQKGQNNWKNYQRLEVQFRLVVPRTAVLDEIETVNGSVTVSNFVNTTRVSAVNGQVRATNLRGSASLSTVNGTVNANFDSLDGGNRISLETVNGTVNLTIPSDSSATLKADTVNGRIENDFNLPVRKGEYVGRDLHGRLGAGGAQINLSSVNGGLYIKRKDDGKNLSQPINLLNEKDNDNDWDGVSGVTPAAPPAPAAPRVPRAPRPPRAPGINSAQINGEVQRALKESEKERAAALDEARRELDEAIKELRENEDLAPETRRIAEQSLRAAYEQLKNVGTINLEQLRGQIDSLKLEELTRLAELNWSAAEPRIEKKSETFTVKGVPKVTINAKNCDVNVRGWDRQEVQYVVKKLSRSRNEKPAQMTADAGDSNVKITVVNEEDDVFNDGKTVFVEVFVPKKSNLKIVTDGEIRLENVSGELDLTGADASINVRDADGKLRLATADGRVRVIGFRGELDAEARDGEMFLEGDFSRINAKSVAGNVYLTLSENASALIKTNGNIGFQGETSRGLAVTNAAGSEDAPPAQTCADCPKGFVFVKEASDTWRVGKGENKFSFSFSEGNLFIRNPRVLAAN